MGPRELLCCGEGAGEGEADFLLKGFSLQELLASCLGVCVEGAGGLGGVLDSAGNSTAMGLEVEGGLGGGGGRDFLRLALRLGCGVAGAELVLAGGPAGAGRGEGRGI